ncbi:hypothetical protein VN12_14775 [Pirellula sp. SH-Sr6A]|uniref:Ig-like domain-containing protein n=1 Tax=Pirellula sp. SH-Sr6A TaxID=1632865 RepID=UPI00078EC5DD|nr:Ig-like domain-containing protein [Pirellula sp. SH-Sr6A]AMV33387.1 hypothetical protein VN12_14775 [Pirellula sp. SH-Sr6A]
MFRPASFALSCCALLLFGALSGCANRIPTASVTGTITINGKPVEGIEVQFVPEAKVRPSIGMTDAQGRYRAEFLTTQSGVVLGSCVVQLSIYRGESMKNYLPKKFNEDAASNPEFNLNVVEGGITFDYDIKYDGEIPPFVPM